MMRVPRNRVVNKPAAEIVRGLVGRRGATAA